MNWRDSPLWMSREERLRLDRERKAYRLELDASMNNPGSVVHDDKCTKHMKREARYGRQSTGFDWDEVLERYSHRCAFCDATEAKLTVDHIIPLSRGGSNWPWNIRPLCEPCNDMKGPRLDIEFPLGRRIW